MQLLCKAVQEPHSGQTEVGDPFPNLNVGETYIGFAMTVMDARVWVDILSPHRYLYPVPLSLFDIQDGSMPASWICRWHGGMLQLGPPEFFTDFFHDLLSDGDATTVEIFESTIRRDYPNEQW